MPVLTINPSVDGRASRSGSESFADKRAGAGDAVDNSGTSINMPSLDGDSTPNYAFLARGMFIFDTSGVPDGSTITNAKLRLYVIAKQDNHNLAINVTSLTTASGTALIAADYNIANHGSVNFLDASVDITSISTGSYLELTLNSAGKAGISKTGLTKLGLRFDADISNGTPTYNDGVSALEIQMVENASNKPELVITYGSEGMIMASEI
jgi:hypothetical protein